MKTLKLIAIVASLLMVGMMVAPTFAVNGPLTDHLQYIFYSDADSLFNGLVAGTVDIMAWPLTPTQYATASGLTNVTTAPYFELGIYEIGFNNNATDPSHTAYRKAMNYTEFRQALACLVDKDTLIAGPTVNGFGTRDDTEIPRPILNDWVNFGNSKYDANGVPINNYPWDYSELHAATILWDNFWLSHVTYASPAAVIAALPLPAGSVHYPPGHPNAGNPIDTIIAYVRTHAPRKAAGEALLGEMTKFGIASTEILGGSGVCYTPVFVDHDFDFYTAGWSFGIHPVFWDSSFTPKGIYAGGQNLLMFDDANMTTHAELQYPFAISGAQSIAEGKICQDIETRLVPNVPLFTNAGYMGYRTGVVGAINFRGYALETALEYTLMNAKTPPYSHPMTIKYGTVDIPVAINPIFSSWVWDYEVVDRIYNGFMNTNPYKPTVPGKSPTGGDLPWMAYDWNFQLSNFTGGGGFGNPLDNYVNMANVTYWLRHDIKWSDNVPFTVDDFNYTMYVQKTYGDSWGQSDFAHVVNVVKIDSWTVSVLFDMPTFYALYTPLYDVVPKHVFENINFPANMTEVQAGTSTTGLHGYWAGKDSLITEISGGSPFTWAQLTGAGGEQYVWVGTGMWKYVPGTFVPGVSGGLVCDPNPYFWMNITQGEIDFAYNWNAGPAPQGGKYSVGLLDLVLLANAYGTSGNGHPNPFKLGGLHVWEPGCDLAPPASTVGLSDLVTLALNYGKNWGANP